jgi:hypothetical protein
MHPNREDVHKYKMMVNGELVTKPVRLQHGDRVLCGLHHYFLYVDPCVNYDEECDYEIALKEANKEQMSIAMADENFEKKMKEMEQKIKLEQERKDQEIKEQAQRLEAEREK